MDDSVCLIPTEWIQQKLSSGCDFGCDGDRTAFVLMANVAKENKCAQQQTRTEQVAQRRQIWNRGCVRVDLELPHRMDYHVGDE